MSRTNSQLAQLLHEQTLENEGLVTRLEELQSRLARAERLLYDLGYQLDQQGRLANTMREGEDDASREAETRKRILECEKQVLECEERARVAEKAKETLLSKVRTIEENWTKVKDFVMSRQQQTVDSFASFTTLIQTGQGTLYLGPPPHDPRHNSQQHRNSYPLPSQRPSLQPISPTNRNIPLPMPVQAQVTRTSQFNTAGPPLQRGRDPYPQASYTERASLMQRKSTIFAPIQRPPKEGSPDVDDLLLDATASPPKRPLDATNGNERKRQKIFNGHEIDLSAAGHTATVHHPLTPQNSASLTPRGPPTTTPTPHTLPNGTIVSVYPTHDGSGKRICRQCGVPGRYKDGKCIEKWGPGPMGAGTVCDKCRKRMRRESGKGLERSESKVAPGLVGGQRDIIKHDILHTPHHASTLPTTLPSRPPTGLEHHAHHPRADTLPAISLNSHSTSQAPGFKRASSSNHADASQESSSDDADADADVDPEVETEIIRTLSPMPPPGGANYNNGNGNNMLSTSPSSAPNRTLSPLPGMRTRTLSPHPPLDHQPRGTLMTTSPLPQGMLELPSEGSGGKVVTTSPYAMTVDIGSDDEEFMEAVDASEGRRT